jgi:hypothetical protein
MLLVANGLADVIENFQQLSFFLSNPPSVARLAPFPSPAVSRYSPTHPIAL